jgi:DNA-binding SARP family transcriptional activator
MEFRVLGPLEVVDDGRPVRLERRLSRALLAFLLLHANELVSSDRLIDELWGAEAPRTATASLQNYVSRLRKALGADVLVSRPGGYLLRVDPERFDLARFDRLVAEAHASPATERAELLRSALALWRGPPLEDLVFEEFAQAEIAQLADRRLAATEERIDAELELGLGAELVDELETLIAAHPLRERPHRQLMLALYRAGRQADALAAYQEARRMLGDELGLEPGEELRALERRILGQDPSLRGVGGELPAAGESRRTVSVLCCELVDSTRLATVLDAEAFRRVISAYLAAVRGAIEAHGGLVETFMGDAVMAVFGVPDLHEDDALRAVRAAVEARASIAKLNDVTSRQSGVQPAIRIALNTGEVITSGAGEKALVTGAVVNVAAHLEQLAGRNEIVLSEETRRLVHDAVRAEPIERDEGFRGWRLDELIAAETALARPLDAPLVGRRQELRRLRSAFRSAQAERSCRVVTVVGEAGIGKTRLARELVAEVGDEARVLVGRCAAYGAGATYLPLGEIVRQAAPDASLAGIAALLEGEDDAEQVAERIAELVGIVEGPAVPAEAFWAVRRLFEAIARERPVLVAFDDVHWAEPTLLDLVEYLGEWAEAPLLVLCVARRDLLEARPGWGGPTSTGFVVELGPLAADDLGRLVDGLSGGLVAADVREQIAERSGGNPLFAEQLLALAEEAPDLSLDRAPPTVEALIASRLDHLAPRELSLLRRASVVGRRFARADVNDLGPGEDADFAGMVRRGLVHPTEDGFRFHHILVRDVAYRGIPKAERAELHERIADGLARRDGADEHVGYHLEQAFRCRAELALVDDRARRLSRAAGERLGRAGIRAWTRGDAPAALNLLGRATELLPADDPTRRELLCDLGIAYWTAENVERAEETLREALLRAESARDRRIELRAGLELANLRLFHDPSAGADQVLDLAAARIPFFDEVGDDHSLARAWLITAYIHGGLRCRYKPSEEAAERAIVHARRSGWEPSVSVQRLAAALYYGPTPAGEASRRCESLLAEAGRATEATVLVFLAGLRALQGSLEEARALVDRARQRYLELGWTVQLATSAATVVADIATLAGEDDIAESALQESCATLQRLDEQVHLATQAAQLAEILLRCGRDDEAERWIDISRTIAGEDDTSAQLAWRTVLARTLARCGDTRAAENLAREAVRLAEGTDALNHRGRALLGLVDVLRMDGRTEEASTYVERALREFEQKENVVAANRTRELLNQLAPA